MKYEVGTVRHGYKLKDLVPDDTFKTKGNVNVFVVFASCQSIDELTRGKRIVYNLTTENLVILEEGIEVILLGKIKYMNFEES